MSAGEGGLSVCLAEGQHTSALIIVPLQVAKNYQWKLEPCQAEAGTGAQVHDVAGLAVPASLLRIQQVAKRRLNLQRNAPPSVCTTSTYMGCIPLESPTRSRSEI